MHVWAVSNENKVTAAVYWRDFNGWRICLQKSYMPTSFKRRLNYNFSRN